MLVLELIRKLQEMPEDVEVLRDWDLQSVTQVWIEEGKVVIS